MSSSMAHSSSSSSTSTRRRRKYSSMDSIYSIVFGLALRSVVGLASKQDWKVAAPIVGLWEGVITLHFMKMMPSSFDPYVSWAVRMFIDYLVTESISRMVLVIIWTCLGMALADVAPAIWRDTGLHRPWRRVRRDLYKIYKMTPKVLPRTRVVRFSDSRHSIIDTPMTFPEIDISERTTVVSDTNPPDSPRFKSKEIRSKDRSSSSRKRVAKASGYSTASTSDAGSATPISRVSAPSLSVPTPTLRTKRVAVYHEPASDVDETRSHISEDVDSDNLSSGRSSTSTSLPNSTQATPRHEDWDLESSIASAPEIDVEQELATAAVEAQATQAKKEEDESTPRARPMYLPPTPSDSAARWDLSVTDKDHILPPPTAFLQQIPDDNQDYDHVAPAASVLSKVTEETGLNLKAPSPPPKDELNLPESYRKSTHSPMSHNSLGLGLQTPDPTPMVERGPSAANAAPVRVGVLEKVWEGTPRSEAVEEKDWEGSPRSEASSILAVPAGPSPSLPQPPLFTANLSGFNLNLDLSPPRTTSSVASATPTATPNGNGYATALSPTGTVDDDDMYYDEETSNSLRAQFEREAAAKKAVEEAIDYARLLEERHRAEDAERKRVEEEKKRLEEERQRYEAEQRRLAAEQRRQEEQRLRMEWEKRRQDEEKQRIEEERRKQEEQRLKLEEEKRKQEEERLRLEEEKRRLEEEARLRVKLGTGMD
ncbi:hypothetical protein NMY22_g17595 [Coprinellus aureogranulatus]|nr:hypothetical protein NMY22_g17595 [Coprinellus aureogranulatus]